MTARLGLRATSDVHGADEARGTLVATSQRAEQRRWSRCRGKGENRVDEECRKKEQRGVWSASMEVEEPRRRVVGSLAWKNRNGAAFYKRK